MQKLALITAAALIFAVYLCIALAVLGVDKFYFIMAGGKKFATFPDWNSQLGIGLSYLTLEVLYLVWLLRTKRDYAFPRFVNILRCTAVFLALAFLAYPLGDDVYLYLHFGLMNLSGVNPLIHKASSFTSQLSPFVDWGQTSAYGAVSQLLFTVSAAVVPLSPILAVYVYKSFCLCLHIINGYLIWRLLLPKRGKITIAYLLNPLLLMEQVGSGHVDILVSTSCIILVGSLTRKRYVLAFLAIWLGFLSKTLPIIWMPLVSIFVVRQRSWKQLAGVVILSVVVLIVLWITVLPGFEAWASLLNPGVVGKYQSSIHALVKSELDLVRISDHKLMTLHQEREILQKFTQYTLIGFAGFYGWIVYRAYGKRYDSQLNLITDLGWVTLTLLLVATPWLMPWYASVLLPIAALIPQAQLFGLTSLMFSLSSSSIYLLQGLNGIESIVAFGLPTLVLLVWALGGVQETRAETK
jgi:alpha-1,6-mannosyltransferase